MTNKICIYVDDAVIKQKGTITEVHFNHGSVHFFKAVIEYWPLERIIRTARQYLDHPMTMSPHPAIADIRPYTWPHLDE